MMRILHILWFAMAINLSMSSNFSTPHTQTHNLAHAKFHSLICEIVKNFFSVRGDVLLI